MTTSVHRCNIDIQEFNLETNKIKFSRRERERWSFKPWPGLDAISLTIATGLLPLVREVLWCMLTSLHPFVWSEVLLVGWSTTPFVCNWSLWMRSKSSGTGLSRNCHISSMERRLRMYEWVVRGWFGDRRGWGGYCSICTRRDLTDNVNTHISSINAIHLPESEIGPAWASWKH